ncbi:MAG: DUF86 domain-containing protein [Candidatus Paceibacteria bacterium]
MFDSKNVLYILTMLEAIEKIFIYSADFEEELKTSNKINWKNLSAMRDKVSHNYRGIDESMVWEIIKDYLPTLKILLIEMLPKIENSELYIKEALKTQYYEELHYLIYIKK